VGDVLVLVGDIVGDILVLVGDIVGDIVLDSVLVVNVSIVSLIVLENVVRRLELIKKTPQKMCEIKLFSHACLPRLKKWKIWPFFNGS
jgi:hypothetical protein